MADYQRRFGCTEQAEERCKCTSEEAEDGGLVANGGLSADFNILRTKGHKPFFRGSSLKFRHADKLCTCKRNGANTASVAQA